MLSIPYWTKQMLLLLIVRWKTEYVLSKICWMEEPKQKKTANNKLLFIEKYIFVFFVFSLVCVRWIALVWLALPCATHPIVHLQCDCIHSPIPHRVYARNEWKVQEQRNHYNISLKLMPNCAKHNNNNNNNNTNANVKYADDVLWDLTQINVIVVDDVVVVVHISYGPAMCTAFAASAFMCNVWFCSLRTIKTETKKNVRNTLQRNGNDNDNASALRRQQFLSKGKFRYFPNTLGSSFTLVILFIFFLFWFWHICKLVGLHFWCGEKGAENSNSLIVMHILLKKYS